MKTMFKGLPSLCKQGMPDCIAACTSGISIALPFLSGVLGLMKGISSSWFGHFKGLFDGKHLAFFGLGLFKKPFLNPPNEFWLLKDSDPEICSFYKAIEMVIVGYISITATVYQRSVVNIY